MSNTSQTALERAKTFAAGALHLLVNGQWVAPSSGMTFASVDPATGEHLATVPLADAVDLDRAVGAARKAFEDGVWGRLTPAQRQRMIWRIGDLLEENADEFAALETLDNGKPLRDARGDVSHAVEILRYCAGWATKINGETVGVSRPGDWHAYTVREPVGVVGHIVPWNAPLMMAVAKIAPALAAGCTMILKPAEQTPLSALRLGELLQEAGIPDGVVNILTGPGDPLGAAMVAHPGIDKIAFTGSTAVGRSILRAAADDMKRVSLELGGKSPVIVLPDADVGKAVNGAARGIFANTGQVCNAGSRLYVHSSLFETVVDGIAEFAENLQVGPGLSESTEMGPVISEGQLDTVLGYVATGEAEGAKVRTGGRRAPGTGYFVEPTVLTGTTTDMRVAREEIFGPVLCAMSFDDADLAAIARAANQTSYGLGASVWTRDLSAAHRLARMLAVGTVRINGGGLDPALPFGGFKESGWGRESGREGVELFTELKSVVVSL